LPLLAPVKDSETRAILSRIAASGQLVFVPGNIHIDFLRLTHALDASAM